MWRTAGPVSQGVVAALGRQGALQPTTAGCKASALISESTRVVPACSHSGNIFIVVEEHQIQFCTTKLNWEKDAPSLNPVIRLKQLLGCSRLCGPIIYVFIHLEVLICTFHFHLVDSSLVSPQLFCLMMK